jgi:hypothetical protein
VDYKKALLDLIFVLRATIVNRCLYNMIALKVISAHPDHLTLILVLLEYLLVQMNKQQTPINIEVSDDDKSLLYMTSLIRTIRQSELFLLDVSIVILFFFLLLLSSFSYIYIYRIRITSRFIHHYCFKFF